MYRWTKSVRCVAALLRHFRIQIFDFRFDGGLGRQWLDFHFDFQISVLFLSSVFVGGQSLSGVGRLVTAFAAPHTGGVDPSTMYRWTNGVRCEVRNFRLSTADSQFDGGWRRQWLNFHFHIRFRFSEFIFISASRSLFFWGPCSLRTAFTLYGVDKPCQILDTIEFFLKKFLGGSLTRPNRPSGAVYVKNG
jgi:hypothetical protein